MEKFLHTHPGLEKKLGLDKDHVIVDKAQADFARQNVGVQLSMDDALKFAVVSPSDAASSVYEQQRAFSMSVHLQEYLAKNSDFKMEDDKGTLFTLKVLGIMKDGTVEVRVTPMLRKGETYDGYVNNFTTNPKKAIDNMLKQFKEQMSMGQYKEAVLDTPTPGPRIHPSHSVIGKRWDHEPLTTSMSWVGMEIFFRGNYYIAQAAPDRSGKLPIIAVDEGAFTSAHIGRVQLVNRFSNKPLPDGTDTK